MESIRYQGTDLSASNWNLLSQFDDFAHAYMDNTTGQATLQTDDDGAATGVVETKVVGGAPAVKTRQVSYFGRLGYRFNEKYMFNATIRADGSSRFSKGILRLNQKFMKIIFNFTIAEDGQKYQPLN